MFFGIIGMLILYVLLKYILAWIRYFNSQDERLGQSTWRWSYDYEVDGERDISDLDDKNFGNKNFVKNVKSKSNIFIIGYMNSLKKHSVDSFKKNGCDLILSGPSLLKNIESLTLCRHGKALTIFCLKKGMIDNGWF